MVKVIAPKTPLPDFRITVNENFEEVVGLIVQCHGEESETEPENKFPGKIWVDTSGAIKVVKIWDGEQWRDLAQGNGDMLTLVYDPDKDGRVYGLPEYDAEHQELVFPF